MKKKLEVNGYNLNQCDEIYRRLNIRLDSTQLCAGGERGRDSCNGDSGCAFNVNFKCCVNGCSGINFERQTTLISVHFRWSANW